MQYFRTGSVSVSRHDESNPLIQDIYTTGFFTPADGNRTRSQVQKEGWYIL
jgi:hypothetical protein